MLAVSACVAGCDASDEAPVRPRDADIPLKAPPPNMQVPAPLPGAICEVNVVGTGLIDLEEEYLPGVVTCENGGADIEALKAQAISARSVAYYNMETSGEICDSQGCQVFSCGNAPTAEAIQAVQETSGMYLMYNSTLTYGFYVAGDNNTSGPDCVGVGGSTEQWITYNSGQSGFDVEQTALGFVHPTDDPSYGQNRGCMGQWGARCLEEGGADYMDILRFYYGEDIEVVQAQGECVLPVDTTEGGSDSDPTTGDATGGGEESGAGPTGGSDPTDPGGDAETGDGEAGTGPGVDSVSGTGPGNGSDAEGSDSDATGPTAGETGLASDGALPDGFGEDASNSGCNCTSGRNDLGPTASLWGLLLLGLRRRRARRA